MPHAWSTDLTSFLPHVDPFMSVKCVLTGVAFPTLSAPIGFLSRVDSAVSDKVGFPAETFPANWALAGLLSRPRLVGCPWASPLPVAFGAVPFALVRLLPLVVSFVGQKVDPVREAFLALGAPVNLLSYVSSLVGHQVYALLEALPTVGAFIDPFTFHRSILTLRRIGSWLEISREIKIGLSSLEGFRGSVCRHLVTKQG